MDDLPDDTGDSSESSTAVDPGPYIIPPQPCPVDPHAPCSADQPCQRGDCVQVDGFAKECRQVCGPTLPCPLGTCTPKGPDSADGYCTWQDDGEPALWCPNLPNCAGLACDEAGCTSGLSCVGWECAFACTDSDDCGNGEVCVESKCVVASTTELADPCYLGRARGAYGKSTSNAPSSGGSR